MSKFLETSGLKTTEITNKTVDNLGPDSNQLYAIYKRTGVNIYNGSNTPTSITRYCRHNGTEWAYSYLPTQAGFGDWTPIGWRIDTAATDKQQSTGEATDSNVFYSIYTKTVSFHEIGKTTTKTHYLNKNSSDSFYLNIPTPDIYNNNGWSIADNNNPWRADTKAETGDQGSGEKNTSFSNKTDFYATLPLHRIKI